MLHQQRVENIQFQSIPNEKDENFGLVRAIPIWPVGHELAFKQYDITFQGHLSTCKSKQYFNFV